MNMLDLLKATVGCGLIAYLFFTFPVLGQILSVALMSVLWLSYLRKTVATMRARRTA